MKEKFSFWTAANILSLCRVPLAILFIVFIHHTSLALTFLLLAALTDFFDGILARRFGVSTGYGVIVDPFADKFFVAVVAVTLFLSHGLPVWQLFLFLLKDIFLAPLLILFFAFGARKKILTFSQAKRYGKTATACQFFTLILIFLYSPLQQPLLLITILFNIAAIIEYLHKYGEIRDR